VSKVSQKVLVLGGTGRIGSRVAQDLIAHTSAQVIITGRQIELGKKCADTLGEKVSFLPLDLADIAGLVRAISTSNLVIHCAGPFHHRDANVLKTCIDLGVNYLDVSDHRSFTQKNLAYRAQAEQAGITAILNTGVFPGISNSMVRLAIEKLDTPEAIHLSYVVSGSGGAGLTIMKTTFLGLVNEFEAWLDGKWHKIKPYSQRETIEFPAPYGKVGVYWFDMPETLTLAESFPVKTVITKFGSVPDLYNYLTWLVARLTPKKWWKNAQIIESLSQISYKMTQVSDRFSGIGVAMRAAVTGIKDGKSVTYCVTTAYDNTAVAAGFGTGSLAQLILEGKLNKPGVWVVEQALSTNLFTAAMQSRGLILNTEWL
jgi:saccharopine dehydrogenase-like NADP-dependent oxidoreductase